MCANQKRMQTRSVGGTHFTATTVAHDLMKAVISVSVRPSERYCHTMCLSDPDTAVLVGGESADQNYCADSLWKLELGQWSLSANESLIN